jgi:hypothetical protein
MHIQMRRGPEKDLPVLLEGEPAWCTDTGHLYVGTTNGNFCINATPTITITYWGTEEDAIKRRNKNGKK